ncbi:MAG TPA: DNA polymerase [Solirubrobacteraceae bacterium]|nr:DNA polymerase [Solirubrobacteraceae bacterium]
MPELQDLSGVRLRLVETIDDLHELKRWMGGRRTVLGVDTETGGLDWWREPLRTVQLGDADTGWCMDARLWLGAARELIEAYEGPVAFHNAKFDMHFLETNGVDVGRHRVHDTRVMAHLLDPTKSTALKAVSARLVHRAAAAGAAQLKRAMSDAKWTWRTVPVDFGPYWQYAALDPVLTARLYDLFRPQVGASFGEVYELEMACQLVLMGMERRGARVDRDYCAAMMDKLEAYLLEMRSWIKYEFGVENPGSDRQVIARLHADGLRWDKKTEKGNVACDREVLQSLPHPFAAAVIQFRDATKLLKTYLKNFYELADADGLLHASINPLGARTGRMSISRPSMQNLPRSQHPRNAIVAREGNVLVLADYDQIEMRLLAHFAQEQAMIAAIRYGDQMTAAGHKGYDVHSMNARGIYGLGMDEPVPKQKRQVTKNSGFAKIYGAGLAQFARTAAIPEPEAKAFLELYDQRFPGVTRFQHEVIQVAVGRARASQREGGDGMAWVTAPCGRRHPCEVRKTYKLVNYLIQGTAADVFKRALVNVDYAGLADYLVLPVHDEAVADVPADEAEEYGRELVKAMENRDDFAVPLTVDLEQYPVWGHKYVRDGEAIWLPPDIEETLVREDALW